MGKTVNSVVEAWTEVHKMVPENFKKDEILSNNAGYDIYVINGNDYISDLSTRLEVNIGGKSTNIWIKPQVLESKEIEIRRSNVTPKEFLAYIFKKLEKKHMSLGVSFDDFGNPAYSYGSSFHIENGKKYSYYTENKMILDQHVTIKDAVYDTVVSETIRNFAYDYQRYYLYTDGTCFNEICEFTFDDDKKGTGYYYQIE